MVHSKKSVCYVNVVKRLLARCRRQIVDICLVSMVLLTLVETGKSAF